MHHDDNAASTDTVSIETADISGEGQVAVENAWMEYAHNRYLSVRVGKQLSPQYWWQNHYPNLTYSTDLPIYLRELFPPELVGVMVQGQVAKPVGSSEFGVGYKFYVANNDFEGNSQSRYAGRQGLGRSIAGAVPDKRTPQTIRRGRRLYEGHVGILGQDVADDKVDRFRRPARSQSLPAQRRVRARRIGRADAIRLLCAAGRAPASRTG